MDTETLVRVAPLISGPLLSQRTAIRKQVLAATLSYAEPGSTFTISKLRETTAKIFGIRFEDAAVAASLEHLEEDGFVLFAQGNTYRLIRHTTLPSVSKLFANAWTEFSKMLTGRYMDYDPHWTDKSAQEIFEQVLLSLFAEIAQTSEYLSRQIELLGHKDFDRIVDSKLKEKHFSNPKAFKDVLSEYLAVPTPVLSNLFAEVYGGIINFDILLREEALPAAHIESNIKLLLLDTNVLAALLSQSDRLHLLASVVCKRSAVIGIRLAYSEATAA